VDKHLLQPSTADRYGSERSNHGSRPERMGGREKRGRSLKNLESEEE